MTYEIFKEYMQRYEYESELEKKQKEEEEKFIKRVKNTIEEGISVELNNNVYYVNLTFEYEPRSYRYGDYYGYMEIVKDVYPNQDLPLNEKYIIIEYVQDEYRKVIEFVGKKIEEKRQEYKPIPTLEDTQFEFKQPKKKKLFGLI